MTEVAQTTSLADERDRSVSVFGPPAMLAAAAVGFGIGVVVTLAFAPLLGAKHHKASALPTLIPTSVGAMHAEVASLANTALGFSPLRPGKHRLLAVKVVPDFYRSLNYNHQTVTYDVSVTWQLNPNVVSRTAQAGSARADCFALLKALYSNSLPVATISLVGLFQFPHKHISTTVLRATSYPDVYSKFYPWTHLPRGSENQVWASLRPHWMAPRFGR